MSLPDLTWQMVYGRLAWAIVLATLLTALVPGAWRHSRRLPLAALGLMALACLLPGQSSPAWTLGLAFQYPSALLTSCCLLKLLDRRRGLRGICALPPGLAAPLAIAGAALYLDAFGVISQGYYYAGFSATAVPILAVLASAACAAAIIRGRSRRQALPLLGALLLFSLLRLPTGNVWDAVLDPILWGWALVALATAALRRMRRLPAVHDTQPEPAPVLSVAGVDPYSTIKEQVSGKVSGNLSSK
ncbi:hypothetical protein [Massilia sp. DD77]|uniref:hypothetical protein n=1 Tax=Massilia sp. DD77 TaxID=3109349 RepID=UPI0030009B20